MKKKLLIPIVLLGAFLLAVLYLRYGSGGTEALWNASRDGTWFLPLVVVSALIDSINPCAFSVLLITIGFLLSTGAMQKKLLLVGGAYIFGIFIAYTGIGLGILKALSFFGIPHFMSKAGALLLILLGLWSILAEYIPALPKLGIPARIHAKMATLINRSSVPAAIFLGILVALCEFPCTGGPYLMILGLIHDSGTFVSGLGYLVLYNIIFILPLGIILTIASNDEILGSLRRFKQNNMKGFRISAGIAAILLAILILVL